VSMAARRPSVTLRRFFEVASDLLEGSMDAAGATRILGPCPEGDAALARYARFVHRQRRAVIDGFFEATKALSARDDPARFDRLADSFIAVSPPCGWEPNGWATGFAAHLERLHRTGTDIPEAMTELADYAVVRWEVSVGGPIAVRSYAYDVVDLSRKGHATREAPVRAPTTIVVGLSRTTNRVVVVTPTLATLVAIARRSDASVAPPSPAMTEDDVVSADADLVARGLLPPACAAPRGH